MSWFLAPLMRYRDRYEPQVSTLTGPKGHTQGVSRCKSTRSIYGKYLRSLHHVVRMRLGRILPRSVHGPHVARRTSTRLLLTGCSETHSHCKNASSPSDAILNLECAHGEYLDSNSKTAARPKREENHEACDWRRSKRTVSELQSMVVVEGL